ncbi:MAG: hypothetical protein KAT17_01835 [Candidatus Aminicenantes bacterium]|nr:hypothetical protein [Candidatus Aminicenantes bacterium]
MNTDYKREIQERELIKQVTKTPRFVAGMMLISIAVLALLAYTVKIQSNIQKTMRENIYWILIFIIILILIAILSIRKTIYYSTRFIKENDTLDQILHKWTKIDIILLASGEIIPVLGLIITWLGIPFERTGFIFLVSAILMIILMPVGIKTRGKLEILRKHMKVI